MTRQYSKNYSSIPLVYQSIVTLFIFLCLFAATTFKQAYADECSGIKLTATCGLTGGTTGTGKFCGGNCGVAGSVNSLYTCSCTAPGKCSRIGVTICTAKCIVVSGSTNPDICPVATKTTLPAKTTPGTTTATSICAKFPAPAGKTISTCDGNNLQQCVGAVSKGVISCAGNGCHVNSGLGVNDSCYPPASRPAGGTNTTVGGTNTAPPASRPAGGSVTTCASTGGTCVTQSICRGNGGIGHASASCTVGQTCCVFPNANGNINITVAPQPLAKPALNLTLPVQINAISNTTASNLLLTENKVLAANIYTATGTLTYNPASSTYVDPTFTLGAIPPGSYKLYLHIDKYLDTPITDLTGNSVFSFPTTQTLTTKLLQPIPGDVAPLPHGDNSIDIQDYTYVLGCLNMKITDPATKTCSDPNRADLNSDGIVDTTDLQIVTSNFSQVGYNPFPPEFTCRTDPSCNSGNNTLQVCALLCSSITPTQ